MGISLTAFRQNLYRHVKEILADETGSLTITSREGDVELVNSVELSSLREFHHLFSSLANAKRLITAIEESGQGKAKSVAVEDLRKLADL